ncbi:hypothetical protein Malapachy_0395 [Malassezia pachydermatis]|uniref:Timeless N-terminal domain-containing protein n=1 Tax=Malassezia pachydermatis TaxID=77020 RepID=A0A0M8MLR6_9BASI|nr:hypothetical protein Malapachy_0395 [Malassezia pachydermatis]KOS12667.1 hypothetical protein Malapachy_0395 [Malassezia pachydermatis]
MVSDAWPEGDVYESDLAEEYAESVDSHSDAGEDRDSLPDDDDVQAGMDMEERVAMLRAPVLSICSALGGYEHMETATGTELVYRLGDDCLECLRDLRRLWRQDDTDASRAMARVFSELGTFSNDLIPILLHSAGQGEKADKIALACTDLMTAMTWPIDWYAELNDIVAREEDEHVLAKLVEVKSAQVQYKSAILQERAKEPRYAERTVLQCVLQHLFLPSLSKSRSERTERDTGILSMCLHFFRNVLAIRDPALTTIASTSAIAHASMQSRLVQQMSETHILDTLLMLASQADTKEYEQWAPIVADCLYQLYVGSDMAALAAPPTTSAASTSGGATLAASLSAEAAMQRQAQRYRSARHSRFGTTIQFKASDGTLRVARMPESLTTPVEQLEERIAEKTRRRISRRRPATERGAPRRANAWTSAAHTILQTWADRFVKDGLFDVLLPTYFRDIHAERERVGDLDTARCKAIQLTTFFLEYALARSFPLVCLGLWTEPWIFRLARARAAMALEARQWLEFVASVRLWTTLCRLLDALSHGTAQERDVADSLQHTLYYDGDYLETALHVMHAYSAQSFMCLESVVDFSYTFTRRLERYASQSDYVLVQKRHGSSAKAERDFQFASFQRAMATSALAHACTQYLARWQDSLHAPTMLPKLASVVHRLAIKAARPALFYTAKLRHTWAHALRDTSQMSAIHPTAARDLSKLHRLFQRGFRRLDEAARHAYDENRRPRASTAPAELYVQSDLTHEQQIGVVVGLLADAHQLSLVTWLKTALDTASDARLALGEMDPFAPPPSLAAQFVPHPLPPPTAASSMPAHCAPLVRLLARLVGIQPSLQMDEAAPWTIPSDATPGDLARDACLLEQFLLEPLAWHDERPLASLVHKMRPSSKRSTAADVAPVAGQERETPLEEAVPGLTSGSSPPSSSPTRPMTFSRPPSPPKDASAGLADAYEQSITPPLFL